MEQPIALLHNTSYEAFVRSIDSFVQTGTCNSKEPSPSEEDWLKTQLLAWSVSAFHRLGLTQYLANFLKAYSKVPYGTFYAGLNGLAERRPHTVLGGAYSKAVEMFTNIRQNKPWLEEQDKFSALIQQPEEYGFLTCITNRREFYREIAYWTADLANLKTLKGQALIGDVLWTQEACIIAPMQQPSEQIDLMHNIPDYLAKYASGEEARLDNGDYSYVVKRPKTYATIEEYAKAMLNWDRTTSRFNKAERVR